jgi:hypothetical protein
MHQKIKQSPQHDLEVDLIVKGMIKFGRKSALTIPRRANPKLC